MLELLERSTVILVQHRTVLLGRAPKEVQRKHVSTFIYNAWHVDAGCAAACRGTRGVQLHVHNPKP